MAFLTLCFGAALFTVDEPPWMLWTRAAMLNVASWQSAIAQWYCLLGQKNAGLWLARALLRSARAAQISTRGCGAAFRACLRLKFHPFNSQVRTLPTSDKLTIFCVFTCVTY